MLRLDFWNVAFTLINLLVLYALAKHFLIGPVLSIMEERKEKIEQDLDSAAEAKKSADTMKETYTQSMQHADDDAMAIVEAAKRRADAEYEKIILNAQAEAEHKIKDAEKVISMEREKSLHDMEAAVANLAMSAAVKILEDKASPAHNQALYNQFISKAGESDDRAGS